MKPLRLSLRTALAVLILLTSVGMGVARGQAPVARHVHLCGSFGIETVAVDAQGNVLTAPGHCPDCAGLLLAVDAPALAAPLQPGLVLSLSPAFAALSARYVEAALRPPARAPPSGGMA